MTGLIVVWLAFGGLSPFDLADQLVQAFAEYEYRGGRDFPACP